MSNIGDAQQIAQSVLKKDRRRIRALAALTIGLWLIAALLIPSVYLPLGAKMKQYARILSADLPNHESFVLRDEAMETPPPQIPMEKLPAVVARMQHEQWILSELVVHQWIVGAIILGLALAAGILASASTVALALTIRRVTLRQVSEQLAEISQQLKQLHRPEGAR